jgi:tetratricopeptide (TPR) repeat protein
VDAAFALGRACLERGRAREAALWHGRVAQWLPDFRRAHLYAAAASFAAGDVASAISHAEAAFSLREDPAGLEAFILPAYEKAARDEPESAAARFRLGRALRRYGRFAEARERLRETLLLDPAFQPARRELSILERFGDEASRGAPGSIGLTLPGRASPVSRATPRGRSRESTGPN